jgi:hypothetical protein
MIVMRIEGFKVTGNPSKIKSGVPLVRVSPLG